MPIDIQREQVHEMACRGVEYLRSIDPGIPFLKLIDLLVENGMIQETAVWVVSQADLADLAIVPKSSAEDMDW